MKLHPSSRYTRLVVDKMLCTGLNTVDITFMKRLVIGVHAQSAKSFQNAKRTIKLLLILVRNPHQPFLDKPFII